MRKPGLLAAGTGIALLLAACGGESAGSEANGAAPAGLMRGGEVTFCTDPEYPPMEYFAEGDTSNPIGFTSDGAKALADLWEVDVKWQITAFDGLMPALQAGRCDILWTALYMSPERLEVADGAPFLETGPGLIVRSGDTSITTTDDLSGKTVAVQGGGSNELTVKALSDEFEAAGKPGITIQAYPKTAETVAAVTNGKADALIETDVAVVDMVSKSNGALVAVDDVFPVDTTFGVFTKKGSPLSGPVAEGLRTLDENGTLASIAADYGLDPSRITTG
ncbi:transporter substrate-binding domain-containing protein [Rhodococcus coprophilus]|uniref:Amino acid ABC transporter substrate-binding protein n=1 Tax=Rhodococcus coprophilus TaxID=38310 RepID=A0A2X4TS21_9NOCA|nr:transporter substrate-binding domain-containing protein [Rhodococcus coprophilus]MBM7457506.1 polar amino acid transport system substrate-binding protein [Rhodococcus coprophilus]SQI29861.1 amino acid ABC transporter substrate-binding protein [Rhodococcus coprophilus]